MTAPLARKALISISSYYGVIYPDGTKTGLFYTEALHPFEVFTKAGFDVDLATETGTYGLDDLSLTDRFLAGDDKAVYDDPEHPFNVKLNSQLMKASDVNAAEYGVFFGSAGHAALYDYPTARGLQAAAQSVWTRGGIVAAVCHGPVLLPGVTDPATGKSIIDGKTVTGFTIEGEVVLEVMDKLTSDGVVPVVTAVSSVDADYSSPMHPFDDYSITAGRVITGANPASARSTAERVVAAFDGLG
ncbi:molecular chaperone Hsp31 [Mycobacterium sp. CBMA293]|uniref:DJ-1/PfpI family protein n=1 Tax=unclassified Mycolicibacterium TaxID=2636767 RepID=UPI0012DD52B5|nr:MULTISPECIES: DJ-1/PfpI family protein [unclassified Mycolicibacterium]MUL47239.1 molecular chaperone Hsp31 [Mycolicibacterium sp. CBMA 360]MUL61349.1 molecular chaperone Hsp31 [Mycolicibacterium sp. CBMA 335]MUL72084.1 molecular chaperone Hsp31 [Mycolicibacterium sp. CBMA 311]MUL96251.1 molecular chaperone Hsp31 [Mycolicibacterium sp. CBMA 230]MUM08925.1 molecular chaperone Hsp31 [Mycolicibacterium sp. CBMA 213]